MARIHVLRKLGDGVGHCTRLLGRHGVSGVGDCFVFDPVAVDGQPRQR
ncbi:hypothetical protein ACVWZP_001359 [Pseudomonas sp. TE36184]